MTFVLFAWIAAIAFGLEVVFSKLLSKYLVKNPFAFSFLFPLFILLLVTPVALLNHAQFPHDPGIVILTGFFYAITTLFYAMALYRVDVSVLSPLFSLRAGIVVLLGAFLVAEVLTPIQYVLIGILIIAGFAVTVEEKFSLKAFFRRDVLIAFGTMLFLSFWNISTKIALQTNSFWDFTLWELIFGQLFLLPTIFLFIKEIKQLNLTRVGALFLASFASSIGTVATTKANATSVSITSVILALPLAMILSFILSFISPKLLEKHTLKVWTIRFIAAGVMLVVALILSR